MKKISAVFLSVSLLASGVSSVQASDQATTVWINGKKIQFDQSELFIEKGVALVPLRPLLQEFGAAMKWDKTTRTVSGTKENFSISMQIGSTNATANGKSVKVNTAPKQIRSVTYAPLRFVAEAGGYQVGWDPSSRRISLTSKPTDPKVRLQDDFYAAVNAKWMESTELPPGKMTTGFFEDLGTNIKKLLSADFRKMAAEGRDKTDDEIGNMVQFYKLAADRQTLNKQGYEAIKADIAAIKSINSLAEFEKNQKDLYFRGLGLPFAMFDLPDMKNATKNALYIDVPVPALPDKSFYSPDNPQSKTYLGLYKKMLSELLVMVGETQQEADRIASEAVAFETEYMQYSLSSEELANFELIYNPKTITELKAYSKNMDLEQFLIDVTGKAPKHISLAQVKYFENLDKIVHENNWPKMKSWTYATFVLRSAPLLSDDFVQTSSQLKKALFGEEKMEDKIYNLVNSPFQYVAGYYYGQKYLGAEAKQDVTNMLKNLIEVYKNKLVKNDWMSEQTKKEAIKKLDNMNTLVGYPDQLDDVYSMFKVDENKTLLENDRFIQTIIMKNSFSTIDQPVDRNEWFMSPNTVNASYLALTNTATIPAAFLQAPVYDKNQSASRNYGGLGAILGHEITHGFDTNGAKYDEVGNLRRWWTAEDYKSFENIAQTVIDQYNGVEYFGRKINGQMTVSENIGDIGGLTGALEAVKQLPDANLKEFYQSWATVWRRETRPEFEEMFFITSRHSPHKVRVNTVIANTDEFYSTFGVKKGDAMYIAPEDRLRIW
ncbi:stalk domain-containing protein [Paenibacillus pasadenensis]|uniref:M13-type metalloendopeptidase n=1 Tax=Paenibacillus pasadenensis TaxID=217090 RepID=UPI0020400644|nr:M13-type metalloendopeptidase [Paenibacillus pasadenensis]MCM3747056.1 stalk domain-containing protein [Paenibacillus pasadenensis]